MLYERTATMLPTTNIVIMGQVWTGTKIANGLFISKRGRRITMVGIPSMPHTRDRILEQSDVVELPEGCLAIYWSGSDIERWPMTTALISKGATRTALNRQALRPSMKPRIAFECKSAT